MVNARVRIYFNILRYLSSRTAKIRVLNLTNSNGVNRRPHHLVLIFTPRYKEFNTLWCYDLHSSVNLTPHGVELLTVHIWHQKDVKRNTGLFCNLLTPLVLNLTPRILQCDKRTLPHLFLVTKQQSGLRTNAWLIMFKCMCHRVYVYKHRIKARTPELGRGITTPGKHGNFTYKSMFHY